MLADCHYRLAGCYEDLGLWQEATAHYEQHLMTLDAGAESIYTREDTESRLDRMKTRLSVTSKTNADVHQQESMPATAATLETDSSCSRSKVMETVPSEVSEQIENSLPDVLPVWRKAINLLGELLPPSSAHVAIACVCLQNGLELFKYARKAIFTAKCEWYRFKDEKVSGQPNEGRFMYAVHFARPHFDHAANCLYAGMNHLAGAMWHFHEGPEGPLGSKYDPADKIRKYWKKERPDAACLPILQNVNNDLNWKTIIDYRNKWTHRELPVIEGEARNRRETVWKAGDAPPPAFYLMAHTDCESGRVAYLGSGYGDHEFRMPELMDAAAEALRVAMLAADSFLTLVNQHFVESLATNGLQYGSSE